jgi:hypothetical protein
MLLTYVIRGSQIKSQNGILHIRYHGVPGYAVSFLCDLQAENELSAKEVFMSGKGQELYIYLSR